MPLRRKRGTLSQTYNDQIKSDFIDAISDKLANLKTEEARSRAQLHIEKAQAQFDTRVERHVLGTEEKRARAFIARELERVARVAGIPNGKVSPTFRERAEIVSSAERHVTVSNHQMIEQIKIKVLNDLNQAIDRLQENEIRGPSRRSTRVEFGRSATRGRQDRGLGE